jgi:hypothetical protein
MRTGWGRIPGEGSGVSRSIRVVVDSERVSPSAVIKASAGAAPLVLVNRRMLVELADELGGQEQTGRFLLDVVERIGRPIGVNVPAADGNSRSMFLAPRGWTQTRLAGWVAGHHNEIEGVFGPAVPVAEVDW